MLLAVIVQKVQALFDLNQRVYTLQEVQQHLGEWANIADTALAYLQEREFIEYIGENRWISIKAWKPSWGPLETNPYEMGVAGITAALQRSGSITHEPRGAYVDAFWGGALGILLAREEVTAEIVSENPIRLIWTRIPR